MHHAILGEPQRFLNCISEVLMGWELALSVGLEQYHKHCVGQEMTVHACNTADGCGLMPGGRLWREE